MKRYRQRAALAMGVVGGFCGAVTYHLLGRPRMLGWGLSGKEAHQPLPGDELVPNATLETNHAITIDAPPSAVWPWIVQIGHGRAGWYTHEWVERLFFIRYLEGHSATRIHPELQGLRVGDEVPYGPGMRFPVTAMEPERYLIIGKSEAFVLQDLEDGRTRLIVRSRGYGWIRALFLRVPVLRQVGAVVDYVVGEPLHHYMEKGMLLGIAGRAEGRTAAPSEQVQASAA
jgi:hypothetical protein